MAENMQKMFVHYSKTKAEFKSAGLETTYTNHIVFIKGDANGNGSCIYTHGIYFANLKEMIETLNFVKGINVGGESYNAAAGGGYIAFSAVDPTTLKLTAGNKGIEIGLSDQFKTMVSQASTNAQNALNKFGDLGELTVSSAIEGSITQLNNALTIALKGTASDNKNNETIIGAINYTAGVESTLNGLIEDVGDTDDLSTDNKEIVAAINELYAAIGTGGTAAVVTVTATGGTSEYAQVYEVKQGGVSVGTINIPKDLVVQSGEVVTNPTGLTAGTYIKLTLQNQVDPLYIDVAKLVDVYTAQKSATQVQLSIDASNVISATIVAGSVTATELASNAVTTAKIANGNVTKEKLSTTLQTSIDKADAAAPQANTYNKGEVDDLLDGLEESVLTSIGENFYNKSDTYSKAEVDAMWEWVEL